MNHGHKTVELLDLAPGLDLDEWKWTRKGTYPFAHAVSLAPTLAHSDGSFYHFGGMMKPDKGDDKIMSPFIASYSPVNDEWTMRGELKHARATSSVIWTESAFLVMGGGNHEPDHEPAQNPPERAEKCEFNGSSKIVCTLQKLESTSRLFILHTCMISIILRD